jgi:3-phosphoshikimate 1-carboxyvinyltransferase
VSGRGRLDSVRGRVARVTSFDPAGPLRGSLRPPSDKSISHRAALIAAMGEGETRIAGYLDAADTRSTLFAVEALGAGLRGVHSDRVEPRITIDGIGLNGPVGGLVDVGTGPPIDVGNVGTGPPIDVGNAGTLLRLLPGWLAGQDGGRWTLDGDDSIRRRPVDRIAAPLREMGADLSASGDRLPPLEIRGAPLHGIAYEMPIASAQVKSCLLFAGLLAAGETRVIERLPSRDHSARMLAAAGAAVTRDGDAVVIQPAERLEPREIAVPADISSAAFFVVAALLVDGSEVVLEEVGINPTRTGLLGILGRMGAEIEVEPTGERGGEPTGRLLVRSTALEGVEVGGAEIPLAIDELPLVALAACFAEGTTTIRDAAELRRKESDRIETVTAALTALGASAEATADGIVIEGTGGLRGGTICSHGDHRIAMLGAVAGLASREGVEVAGMDAAAVSYPGFEPDLASLLPGGA